jgi:hypothetical protein
MPPGGTCAALDPRRPGRRSEDCGCVRRAAARLNQSESAQKRAARAVLPPRLQCREVSGPLGRRPATPRQGRAVRLGGGVGSSRSRSPTPQCRDVSGWSSSGLVSSGRAGRGWNGPVDPPRGAVAAEESPIDDVPAKAGPEAVQLEPRRWSESLMWITSAEGRFGCRGARCRRGSLTPPTGRGAQVPATLRSRPRRRTKRREQPRPVSPDGSRVRATAAAAALRARTQGDLMLIVQGRGLLPVPPPSAPLDAARCRSPRPAPPALAG